MKLKKNEKNSKKYNLIMTILKKIESKKNLTKRQNVRVSKDKCFFNKQTISVKNIE